MLFYQRAFFRQAVAPRRCHQPLEYVETRYSPFLRQGFAWLGVPLLVIDDALKLNMAHPVLAIFLS